MKKFLASLFIALASLAVMSKAAVAADYVDFGTTQTSVVFKDAMVGDFTVTAPFTRTEIKAANRPNTAYAVVTFEVTDKDGKVVQLNSVNMNPGAVRSTGQFETPPGKYSFKITSSQPISFNVVMYHLKPLAVRPAAPATR